MKVNQVRGGIILSYIQLSVSVLLGILYTPFMIRLLGKSEYGLYNTIASTIGMLSMLNLGLGSGYIRYYAKYKKDDDIDAINRLNGFFLLIFLIIGFIAFCGGIFLTFNLKLIFSSGLTPAEFATARVLMILLTVNLTISFPASVIANIVIVHEKYVFNKILGMIQTVLTPMLTLPLLFLGFKSIAMVSVSLILTFVVDIIQLYYVLKVLKSKFIFGRIKKSLLAGVFSYTIFIALNIIVDQINWNIDKILLGRFKGTDAVAIYSVGYSLYHYYMLFSTAISGIFTPRIHKIVNTTIENPLQQKQQLTALFVKVGRIQFLLLALIGSGVVFFGQPFIRFWVGVGYDDAYYVALLLMLPAIVPFCQNIGIEVQRAQNNHYFRSLVYITMAIANLIMSIFLCQKYGAVGSAMGTAISLLLCNGLIINIFYHKKCSIDIIAFWKNIGRLFLGCALPIAVGIVFINFVNLYNIFFLIVSIVAYSVIYCLSQWIIGMNSYEKGLVKNILKKVFYRKNKNVEK